MRTPCPDQQPSGAYVPWRPRRINTARNFLAGSSGVEIRAIVAALPGYLSNHVPGPGTRVSSGFGGYPGAAFWLKTTPPEVPLEAAVEFANAMRMERILSAMNLICGFPPQCP